MALRERVRMGTHAWTPPSSTSTEADDRDRVIAHAIDVMLTRLDTDPDLAGLARDGAPYACDFRHTDNRQRRVGSHAAPTSLSGFTK